MNLFTLLTIGGIFLAVIILSLFWVLRNFLVKGRPLAEQAISRFHEGFNQKKFEQMYLSAHSKFKGATSETQWKALMSAVFRKLGRVKSTKNTNWNVRSFNLTTLAVMTQDTTFEFGKAVETFTFEIKKDDAFLMGYNINSADLILSS